MERTPLLETLNSLASVSKSDTTGAGMKILKRFIHGPIAEVLVNVTPNPYDNALLAVLRQIVPES